MEILPRHVSRGFLLQKGMTMALKSKEWFYKKCLAEVKDYDRFSHLAWGILQKGIGQSDGTRGHVTHIPTIQSADPTLPFDVASHKKLQKDLTTWIAGQIGNFGRGAYGYSYDTFKKNTTATLGGTRVGGGGADDEFKRVLRLMAEYL
jgi:hypothetical protein